MLASVSAAAQVPDTLKAHEASKKAEAFYDVSSYDSARFWFKRSAKLWEEAAQIDGDSLLWARALDHENYVSVCDYVMGRSEEAEKGLKLTLSKVYNIWPSNPVLEAQYYDFQALVYIRKRLLDSAYHHLQKALGLKQQVFEEQSLEIAESYSTLGGLEAYRGRRERALELNLKVLDIRSAMLSADDSRLAKAYNNLGYIYFNLGAVDPALESYLKAIEIRRRNGTDKGYNFALVLGNIGAMYRENGDYKQALAYHHKELEIKKTSLPPDHRSLARNYYNLAKANFEIGEYDLALEYALISLEIFRKTLEDHDPIIGSLRNEVGRALVKKGRFEEAMQYFNDNLKTASARESFLTVAETNNNIAESYLDQGEHAKTLEHYQIALNTLKDGYNNKKLPGVADSYYRIGKLYRKMGETDLALEHLQKSLIFNLQKFENTDPFSHPDVKDTVSDRMLYLDALSSKGEIFTELSSQQKGHLTSADSTWQFAIHHINWLRTSYHNESSKLGLLDKSRKVFENQLQVLYDLYTDTGEQRYLERAFKTVEQTKATVLYEGIKAVKARDFGGIPSDVTSLEESLRIKLAYNEKRIFDLESSNDPENQQKIFEARANFFDYKLSYDSLIQVLEKQYPEYYQLKYGKGINGVEDIQRMITKNTAVIEYMLTDNFLYTFKITDSGLKTIRTEVSQAFKEELLQFIEGLKSRSSAINWGNEEYEQYQKDAYKLYNVLIAPVLQHGDEIDKLIIIPDGMLNYLPFECLVTGPEKEAYGMPYLIRDTNIRYAYSASLMAEDNPDTDLSTESRTSIQ